jgi:cyclic-di-GMP phosphodiesterase TipF (flagellum assembly factor)
VRYVKVSPQLLLAPEAETGAGIRPEDFRELLWRHGIALIGEKIETERQVVDLLDFQIDFGQGFLFGEPRPLKEDQPEAARIEPPRPEPAEPAPAPQPTGMTALFQQRPQRRAVG